MSAYTGYQKPAYGAGGGDDSGGFFAGGSSQQGSQAGGAGKGYQDESLRPVTVKQILDAQGLSSVTEFRIDGSPVSQITCVGQIRSITPASTFTSYKLDDGTGQIEIKKWTDIEKQNDAQDASIEVDAHVRIWGKLSNFGNKKSVTARLVRPVENFNEVNYHMLEATYVHLLNTKGTPGQGGAGGGGGEGGDGDSMFVDGGAGYGAGGGNASGMSSKLAGCTPTAKKMFQFMNNTPGGNEAVHLNQITGGAGMSIRDVMNAADELLGHGLIFTTTDDETWAILEF